jgi:hypothetical protein
MIQYDTRLAFSHIRFLLYHFPPFNFENDSRQLQDGFRKLQQEFSLVTILANPDLQFRPLRTINFQPGLDQFYGRLAAQPKTQRSPLPDQRTRHPIFPQLRACASLGGSRPYQQRCSRLWLLPWIVWNDRGMADQKSYSMQSFTHATH